jgi:hypothetical protein
VFRCSELRTAVAAFVVSDLRIQRNNGDRSRSVAQRLPTQECWSAVHWPETAFEDP